jgi:hypothetical protein
MLTIMNISAGLGLYVAESLLGALVLAGGVLMIAAIGGLDWCWRALRAVRARFRTGAA